MAAVLLLVTIAVDVGSGGGGGGTAGELVLLLPAGDTDETLSKLVTAVVDCWSQLSGVHSVLSSASSEDT